MRTEVPQRISRPTHVEQMLQERHLARPLIGLGNTVDSLWNSLATSASLGDLSREQISSRIKLDTLKAFHTNNITREDFLPDQPRELEDLPMGWNGRIYSCNDHYGKQETTIFFEAILPETRTTRVTEITYAKDLTDGVEEVSISVLDDKATSSKEDKELIFLFYPPEIDMSYEVSGINRSQREGTYRTVQGRVTQSDTGEIHEALTID